MVSYSFKYIKIYSTQMISIILGIISLFVVVPYISSNKEIYGVYSLCISTWIFLTYADLGFFNSATKYAAEFFQLNKRKEEEEVLSFGSFVIFLVALHLSIVYVTLSIHPELLIKDINHSVNFKTAQHLFLWMAVFSPFIAAQRLATALFIIRIEGYISSGVDIVGSILKIISVFYFFSSNCYEIVDYFIFIQTVSIICCIVNFYIAHVRYNYDLKYLLRSFKWNIKCYTLTKDLALSSFAGTITWILCYEIDQIVIAKLYGATQVAIFAIAFAILNYIRMFLGGLFSPFTSRFAHFKATGNMDSLKRFFIKIINITLPVVVCPLVVFFILVYKFIIAWSGLQYADAVTLSQMFILLNIFSFLSYPAGSMMMVFEKTRILKIMATVQPLIYWIGIFLLSPICSILAFGIMKIIFFWMQWPIFSILSFRELDINWLSLTAGLIKYNFLPIVVVIILSMICNHFILVPEKDISSMMLVVIYISIITILGYLLTFFTNQHVREYVVFLKDSYLTKRVNR